MKLTAVDADDQRFIHADGYGVILPKFETVKWVKRFGRFMLGVGWKWDAFGFGIQLLGAGVLLQIANMYWIFCHIERQSAIYETPPKDEAQG